MRISAFLAALLVAATAAPAAAAVGSKDDALAMLAAWTKAQNDGDFAAYGALYSSHFVGVKRTSDGGQKTYTLAAWKADRKKMFKAKQKVTADAPVVAVEGPVIKIRFVQRYQSGGYADHGDKELVLGPGPDGTLNIVREEMLYSAPGWAADPKAELDATALASPITAHVRKTAGDPSAVGGCGGVSYTLELTDAKGKTVKQDIGGGFVSIDKPVELMDADLKGDALFEFGEWCAAGADYYKLVRSGDAIVVRLKSDGEDDPDYPPSPPAEFETIWTVRLPAGATIK